MIQKSLAVAVILLLLICISILPTTGKMILDDTIPPITTHTFTPEVPDGENGWYVSDVFIELNATDDGSGVNATYYKIYQDDDWTEYTDVLIVTEDNYDYSLYYYSVDNAGNEEEVNGPFDFKIDQTPPTICLSWDAENSKIIADVDDETSGVERVEFYVDERLVGIVTEEPYEWEWSGMGGHAVEAIVFDNAGNYEYSPPSYPPPKTRVLGIIRNPEFTDEDISFFAVILISNTFFPCILRQLTFQNDYSGYIGERFIFAVFKYGPV